MSDPLHKTHNKEVTEATERLFTEIIPEFAKRAKDTIVDPAKYLSALDGNLVKEIHKEGKRAFQFRLTYSFPIRH